MDHLDLTSLLDNDAKTFYEATKEKKLLIQYCESCKLHQFYPRSLCMNCLQEISWKESTGKGKVYSYTVVPKNRDPNFKEKVPYVVALVELGENVRLMTNIVDIDPSQVKIGLEVSVVFREKIDDYFVPQFIPS